MIEMSFHPARRIFLRRTIGSALAAPVLASFPSLGLCDGHAEATGAHGRLVTSGKPAVLLNVREFGAVGDGVAKDTVPIQLTIERCSMLGGGEVIVPAGNYLSGALFLRSNVKLHIADGALLSGSPDMADYPLAEVRWEGRWVEGYSALLSAVECSDVAIVGPGKIVGSPAVVGRVERKTTFRLPALIEFTNCRNVQVENCQTKNYGMWSIHPTYCENISFRNVAVESGADGIDVDSCKQVTIERCDFNTTDDCISLKSGRGAEGLSIGRPTEDVFISNCTFTDVRWACIGIGSETSGGIRNVHVQHCKCLGARTFAIYIKSSVERGAFVEDIYMDDLEVTGAGQGFLRINMLNSGRHDEFPVPGKTGIPTIRNFRFSNVRVTDVPVLVQATEISPYKPLEGFTLANVAGSCGKGIFLANIRHAEIRNVKVTGFSGELLNTSHVTGAGIAGAAAIRAEDLPKVPPLVPEPTIPYRLH